MNLKVKNCLTSLFIILMTVSCGKGHKPIPFEDDGLNGTPSLVLLPSNSLGVSEVVDGVDASKFHVLIPASKQYNPSTFNDGWFFIDHSSEFEIGENINVTFGRAGNHLAYLTISRAKDDNGLPKKLNCVYVGQESDTPADYLSPATPYKFDFCTEGSVVINPTNYATLKTGPENILDAPARAGTVLTFSRGDRLAVQVEDGNDEDDLGNQFITTEVEYEFIKTNL